MSDADLIKAGTLVHSVSTTILDIPLRRPHKVAVAELHSQAIVLVRVRLRNGVEGVGESLVPGGPWWSGDSIESVHALIDGHLGPAVVGRDAARTEEIVQFLDRSYAGARFAKSGLESALWDARARSLEVPLHDLFGGRVRDELPVTWALGAAKADVVVEEIEKLLAEDAHQSFKLKMGGSDPQDDVARIRAIAAVVGDRTSLRVDLNGSWDELTADRLLPQLGEAGIEVVEQPLAGWNVDGMARLRQRHRVALMADESLLTPQDAVRLGTARACDLFAVKAAKCGGLSAMSRIGAIAGAMGLACHGGTTLETSVGTAASAHLVLASPAFTAGTELFGPLLLADDIVEEPVVYHNGNIELPTSPGTGVTLDEDKVRHYAR